jgi:hypothetical protein
MWREDVVPPCRSSAHPLHTDRRQWMEVIKEDAEYVVWCCRRCSEITGNAAIQVRVLPRGQARAAYANHPSHHSPPYVRPSGFRPGR